MLVKVDPVPDNALVHAFHIKKVQLVLPILIARNINVIQPGSQRKITERHFKSNSRIRKPTLGLYPWIRHFLLLVPLKYLAEQAHMVVQADSVAGKAQSCDGIQEAGGKPSKSAVSKGRLRLHFFNPGKLPAIFLQDFCHLFIDAKINQVIRQKLPNQEFCGNIV